MGYSLWWMPKGDVYDKLHKIIRDLAKQYQAQEFEPHITVIGDIFRPQEEVVGKARHLASSARPFAAHMNGVDYTGDFWKGLYFQLEKSTPLMDTQARACDLFGLRPEEYDPHISLFYASFGRPVKSRILSMYDKALNELTGSSFEVDSLHVYVASNNVPIKDWRRVEEIPLTA